ncbi:MAG: AMP-binding protein [Deltaproteobacteria bacterium]|nr:AMP-binding protein [Deltaproteobacteria bacterium]
MPSPPRRIVDARGPLDLLGQLQDAEILVLGGTGFLGKVFLSLLLHRAPNIARIHLVVRPKGGLDSEARFWAEIATSQVFDPLREAHPGTEYEAFLRDKIRPIPGDVSRPFAGVPADVRHRLRGKLSALLNASGVVDFNPPLDEALDVNAFGMQSLVALAQDLGDVPVLHTSTAYVAGNRTGWIGEVDPREHPFPRAGHLEGSHWSPEQEIRECVDLVEHVRHRASDAFRQSAFLDSAKQSLRERGEPELGGPLDRELAKVRRKYEEKELARAGTERANHWGWPNTYTYTKSIGEQILANSGLTWCIARPAVIESSVSFPIPGWNEGITTSAPIMYLSMQGMTGMPSSPDSVLDVIPVDMVAAGMVLTLGELIEGTHRAVYHLGSSDVNPLPMERLIELTGLYKRRHYSSKAGKNPLWSWLQSRYETVPVSADTWANKGPAQARDRLRGIAGMLRKASTKLGPLAALAEPAAKGIEEVAKASAGTFRVIDQYVPFTALNSYTFVCRNVRDAHARLPDEQQALFDWTPTSIDWRHYLMEVHLPGVEKLVWPRIEARLARPKAPLAAYENLVDFLDGVAERHGHAPALQLRHVDGFAQISYLDLQEHARSIAVQLVESGVSAGDRVILTGRNSPRWVAGYFGILAAGATVVPVDPGLASDEVGNIALAAEPTAALVDDDSVETLEKAFANGSLTILSLDHVSVSRGDDWLGHVEQGRLGQRPDGSAVASVLFTSGTTGTPKGVMLTHANFCSMLASISRVFKLTEEDRVLSVLPLHHTFEFTCGLLLPLSRGARVTYLDELTADALSSSLADDRITAMVGVPALWQLLERRIQAQVQARGAMFTTVFDAGLELNRMLGRTTGLDLGRLLFGVVHAQLGGNVRLLVSGGAALPESTHRFFAGLGLPLAEGYGLTEAAPVLTVDPARPGAKPGSVGQALPGVELRIEAPDGDGVGEVVARGPNIMAGYFRDREATDAVMTEDGWLRTGDLGRLDGRGRLNLVGRAKDVVVTSAGENVHLDDVESRLGVIAGVAELSLVGLPDPAGGERLGLLAVPEDSDSELARQAAHTRARKALRDAAARLPAWSRPSVVHLVDAPLPRTATRKVKRGEVREVLALIESAATVPRGEDGEAVPAVRHAVSQVAGVAISKVSGSTRLVEDLRFDSLMWVELAAALDQLPGGRPASDALAGCGTVAELEVLVAADRTDLVPVRREEDADTSVPISIPAPLVNPLKVALRRGQRAIYEQALDVSVSGQALIPQNRNVIVVSNHCSHLDFGLVKTALGSYGEGMVGLAAKDYFFEGNSLWVAYFEQLTNLQPFDRGTSFRQSLREAVGTIRGGHVVALFPEGGRQVDGVLKDFKPLVGKLVLETEVDVLPLHIDGSHGVLPKGGFLPRPRRPIHVRIGPPLSNARLRALAAGEGRTRGQESRVVSSVLHAAVKALSKGDVLMLDRVTSWELPGEVLEDPLVSLFAELPTRYTPDGVEDATTWYFSLGGDRGRWTVSVSPGAAECVVREGRPEGTADCVVKTSPTIWTRMVREAWAPDVSDFMGGNIKTSDLDLLMSFARCFRLGPDEGDTDARAKGS